MAQNGAWSTMMLLAPSIRAERSQAKHGQELTCMSHMLHRAPLSYNGCISWSWFGGQTCGGGCAQRLRPLPYFSTSLPRRISQIITPRSLEFGAISCL
jgi:hypothetical protein